MPMNSVFREHLPPLWFGFIGAAAQYPKMENGERKTGKGERNENNYALRFTNNLKNS
jgi:hypothetical protein